MPAAWAGVAVTAASALASGLSSSGAVGGASSQAQALDERARQEGLDNLAYDRANAQPYITTGQNALTRFADFSGVNGSDAAAAAMGSFQSSPGYGFAMDQGLRAVDAGAAAKGMLRSGATLKAEQTFGQGLANQDFNAYMTRLNSLAGFGLQGASLDNQSTSTYDGLLTKTTADASGSSLARGRRMPRSTATRSRESRVR